MQDVVSQILIGLVRLNKELALEGDDRRRLHHPAAIGARGRASETCLATLAPTLVWVITADSITAGDIVSQSRTIHCCQPMTSPECFTAFRDLGGTSGAGRIFRSRGHGWQNLSVLKNHCVVNIKLNPSQVGHHSPYRCIASPYRPKSHRIYARLPRLPTVIYAVGISELPSWTVERTPLGAEQAADGKRRGRLQLIRSLSSSLP